MTPPLAPDILSLIRTGTDIYRYIRDSKLRSIRKGAGPARAIDELYSTLRNMYSDVNVLSGPDGFFPAAVVELAPAQAVNPKMLLGDLVAFKPSQFEESRIVEALKNLGKDLWDDPTFSLADVHLDDQGRALRVDAYMGHYYGQLNTAKYLEFELLKAWQTGSLRTPMRAKVLSSFPSPRDCLLSGGGIDAAISVSALVVYKRESDYWLLCELRSDRVAEGAGLYHVPPSGIFQPVTAPTGPNLSIEFDLIHNLFREYLEELFGVPEVRKSGGALAPDYFYDHNNLAFLRAELARGTARILGTCLMFDLFGHRPEVCMVLLIDDPDWWLIQKGAFSARRADLLHLSLNSEFASNDHGTTGSSLERISTLPLSHSRWLDVVKPWNMVPQGAPSLVLGAKEACRALALPEPEWLKSFSIHRANSG